MTYTELIKAIAELEGKKVEVPVGNIREVMKAIKLLAKADADFYSSLMKYLLK